MLVYAGLGFGTKRQVGENDIAVVLQEQICKGQINAFDYQYTLLN